MARAAHVLTRRATPPSLVGVRVGIWVSSFRSPASLAVAGFRGLSRVASYVGAPVAAGRLTSDAAFDQPSAPPGP